MFDKVKYHKKYWEVNKKQLKQKRIQLILRLKINGCAICGYNECNRALDFHHSNPEDKKFLINTENIHHKYTNKEIVEELNKCVLLCKNCHCEIEEMENVQ